MNEFTEILGNLSYLEHFSDMMPSTEQVQHSEEH